MAKLLVAKRADMNAMDDLGVTVSDEATRKGNVVSILSPTPCPKMNSTPSLV